jgi:uncharacterized membrane protein
MKEAPALVMALIYWLHMLATVTWIGGLAAMALIVLPSAKRVLDATAYAAFLLRIQARLQQVGWLSLLVLGATGMFQMSASSHYSGFLAIDNPWAAAILSKHVAILVMVAASAYSTWGLMPAMQRLALLRANGKKIDTAAAQRQDRQERLLLGLNLTLSALVLAFTAWARVS